MTVILAGMNDAGTGIFRRKKEHPAIRPGVLNESETIKKWRFRQQVL